MIGTFWSNFGRILDEFWTNFGRILDEFWTNLTGVIRMMTDSVKFDSWDWTKMPWDPLVYSSR